MSAAKPRRISRVTSGIFKHSPPEAKQSNYLSPLLIKLRKQFQPGKKKSVSTAHNSAGSDTYPN